ncbi:MAG: mobile mystery protein B [bacterium]|nr:mobile mystery protein B [Candidatus Margulisiibacteriota bacterium]
MPLIENVPGATPLDDLSGLIPDHITTREQLNEWEASNILQAVKKYLNRRREVEINLRWLKEVHRIMFNETWEWAGKFRQKNYNLGVDWHQILEQMKVLVDDLQHWQADRSLSIFSQSVRLHHRLVKIHPFVNGNGRYSRLVSDIFLFANNQPLLVWPDKDLFVAGGIREQYIAALQSADKGSFKLLEEFTTRFIK